MVHRTTLPLLLALIVLHMVLAVLYLVQTPYRTGGAVLINPSVEKDIGAPDERQHANYIRHLLTEADFPVFDPDPANLYETYQSHQPPAYYVLAVGWANIWDVDNVELPRDGIILRILNVLIGATSVAGVFFLCKWGYHREWMALTAAGIAALLPMNLALSGAISNDPLLISLCTWTLAVTALALREGWNSRRAAAVGLLLGFALLTKTSALALGPALLLAAVLSRPKLGQVALVAVPALLIVGGWWIRNQNLYGDPFALGVFREAFGGTAQKTLFTETIIPRIDPAANPEFSYWTDWVAFWTARSFIGVFGYMDIWLTQSGQQASGFDENRLYWVMLGLIMVGFTGWCLSWGSEKLRRAWKVRFVLILFTLTVLAQFIVFNNQYFQAQARYLLPAIGPIACALAVGFHQLGKRRKELVLGAVTAMLLIVNTFALLRLRPQFELRQDPELIERLERPKGSP